MDAHPPRHASPTWPSAGIYKLEQGEQRGQILEQGEQCASSANFYEHEQREQRESFKVQSLDI